MGSELKLSGGHRAALTAIGCGVMATYAVVALTTAAVSPALPHSHAAIGDFMLAHFLGFLVASVVTGFLSDRLGRKGFMLSGCLLLSAGSLGMLWCDRFWLGMAAMGLTGIGGGAMGPPVLAMVGQVHPTRRSGMTSMVESFFCFGAALWPLALAVVLPAAASWRLPGALAFLNREPSVWRLPFAMAAVLPWVLGAAIAVVPFPAFHDVKRRDAGRRLALLKHPFFLLSAAAIFSYAAAEAGTQQWLPRYFDERFTKPLLMGNAALALFWGAMGTCRLAWPVLARWVRDRHMLIASMAAALVLNAAAVAAPYPAAAVLLFGGLGLAFGAVWPLLVAGIGDHYHHMAGTATGTLVAVSGVGAMLGPFVLGQIAQVTTVHVALWSAVGVTALSLAACALIPDGK